MDGRKIAVVTGAGSGIGREISRELLDDGYRVALVGRREGALRETAGERPDALVLPGDIGDPQPVRAVFDAVRDRWGRLDLLVNNAGSFGAPGSVGDLSEADWDEVVRVNLTGAFLCARQAFRIMRDQHPRGGRIINNGSVSAHSPRPGTVGYTATKHAITGLTKSISLDGREHDIACGQIDIGNAATEMTSGIAAGAAQADGAMRAEPTFDVRHVAEAVRYMAGLPLAANVPFLTLTATAMPFLGRG